MNARLPLVVLSSVVLSCIAACGASRDEAAAEDRGAPGTPSTTDGGAGSDAPGAHDGGASADGGARAGDAPLDGHGETGAAAVEDASPPSQTGMLVGLADKCLDAPGGSTADGTALELYSCDGTPAQTWTLAGETLTGPGGKCVAVRDGAGVDGALVELRACDGSAGQRWKLLATGAMVGAGGECLDVRGGGVSADGTPIELWRCTGEANQHWRFGTPTAADAGADSGLVDTGAPPVDDGGTAGGPTTPLGGPGGYATLAYEDSFGSAKPGATITDVAELNPSTPYGLKGRGWDRWMKGYGQGPGDDANVVMYADHLELLPTGGPAGNLVSHFEYLPTDTTRYYLEIRAVTGRGTLSGTWPALWLFAGNSPDALNVQSELDIMETYSDLAMGGPADPSGLYTRYFAATSHEKGGATPESITYVTDPIDVTTAYDVYGCETYLAGGKVMWDIYFNGAKVISSKVGITWESSPPAIIIGWNPGSTPVSPAVMKLDWVRVWEK